MLAIVTTFKPGADHRPAVEAACMGKSVTLPYEAELGLDDNHVAAAQRLATALGWCFDWTFGRLPTGDYCHVAVVDIKQYTTRTMPGTKSPSESWRGRSGISTARRLDYGRR